MIFENPAPAPRFDLYSSIHKGTRAFINSTLEKVGAMDAGDARERFASRWPAATR